ncbi:MAG: methylated-DNA--[protein]-cysteine S-methyltransferase [Gammaproteobacteria bacterium]|nr:methylated-DNA--[protein]-cysteine S-methyltransferase [Gammaproteobacteria bacterium]MBP6479267.1 methylated-DNA--[protein]-cysteine S-methyltransferase [Pseudomonadales bacterium]MBP7909267.1 methylated-DNA--[protein]-cysteine S-methyltransferase [Pseudomonadales bacterium]
MAHATGYALFDTAIGRCAIAWGARGITRCALPAASEEALRRHIAGGRAQAEQPAPPAIAAAITRIVALLAGARDDLRDLVLDLDDIPEFHRRVFATARAIAPGNTVTYGELARRLGTPGAARAVGQALGANPFPIVVPCHRIVAADGSLGGFSAPGGARTKRRMLQIEGAIAQGDMGFE